jgi:biopolymer transport protein ExbB
MLATLQVWALMLLQESGGVSFDPIDMWHQMTWLGKAVVITMFIMSAWSIGVMIDRFLTYNAARKTVPRLRSGRRRRAAGRKAR